MPLTEDAQVRLDHFLDDPAEYLHLLADSPLSCLLVMGADGVAFVIENAKSYGETLHHSQRSRARELQHPALAPIKTAILEGGEFPKAPLGLSQVSFNEALKARALVNEFMRSEKIGSLGFA